MSDTVQPALTPEEWKQAHPIFRALLGPMLSRDEWRDLAARIAALLPPREG